MKIIHMITLLLVIIGGLNWTLWGVLQIDLITNIFGAGGISTIVYVLITISTIYHLSPKMMEHLKAA